MVSRAPPDLGGKYSRHVSGLNCLAVSLHDSLLALEAAWDLLECVPTRQASVDASLQDRVDALEGHLYATQVLQT